MNLRLVVGCALIIFILSAGTIIAMGLLQPVNPSNSKPITNGLTNDLQQVKRDATGNPNATVTNLQSNQTLAAPQQPSAPPQQPSVPSSQQPNVTSPQTSKADQNATAPVANNPQPPAQVYTPPVQVYTPPVYSPPTYYPVRTRAS